MKTDQLPAPSRPAIDHDADAEPKSDIELLGAMLTDNATTGMLLRQLPYERTHYRSNLRMILGAAVRMKERCIRLLREDSDRMPDVVAGPVSTQADDRPDPSNIIDADLPEVEPATAEEMVDAAKRVGRSLMKGLSSEDTVERAGAAVAGVNGRPDPKTKPSGVGRPLYRYTEAEAAVLATLKQMGTASTKELVAAVVSEFGMHAKEVDDVLAGLRIGKHILTDRLGRGILNRVAE